MTFQFDTHRSKVLDQWVASRPGAAERIGANALIEGSQYTLADLSNLYGATGAQSSAGISVTRETAMRVATVYACVRIISETVATLPLNIYERQGGTRKQIDHDYWWMLNETAYDGATATTAWRYVMQAKCLVGDGYAVLRRRDYRSSEVYAWEPFHPDRVHAFREHGSGRLWYRVTDLDGTVGVLPPEDVIHIPSLGFDGLKSPSPITMALREPVGTALAAEAFTASLFRQGATAEIALISEKPLSSEQIEQLRQGYLAKHSGPTNSRIPLILGGGMDVKTLSITPQDAALLPSRMFTVEEICRIFGVPPWMAGHTDKSTSFGTGIEQQAIGFTKYTIRPHLVAIEQEFNRRLFPRSSRYFVAFDTTELERGDFKTRMEGYRVAIGRAGEPGWMTPDEVRHRENMAPMPGGDKLNTGNNNAQAAGAAAQ